MQTDIKKMRFETRDRRFNPWRRPASDAAERIVALVKLSANTHDHSQRTKTAHAVHEAALAALTCDLMHRSVSPLRSNDHGNVRVSRRKADIKKRNIYSAPFDGKPVIKAVDLLCDLGFAKKTETGSWRDRRQTTYAVDRRLAALMHIEGIILEDFTLDAAEEIIILKRAKNEDRDQFEDTSAWVEYRETKRVAGYRKDVRTINEYLRNADFCYSGPKPVDNTKRRLRRYFNEGSLAKGGRLFGGYWQNDLPKRERRNITIEGKASVELDFRSCMLSIAYAHVGLELPKDRDGYEVDDDFTRTGVKKMLASMLFSKRQIKRYPKGIKSLFPSNVKASRVVNTIQQAHLALADVWHKGLGHKFFFIESQILIAILVECINREIVALPNHDGVLIAYDKADEVTEIMLEKFAEIAGQPTTVHRTEIA